MIGPAALIWLLLSCCVIVLILCLCCVVDVVVMLYDVVNLCKMGSLYLLSP